MLLIKKRKCKDRDTVMFLRLLIIFFFFFGFEGSYRLTNEMNARI